MLNFLKYALIFLFFIPGFLHAQEMKWSTPQKLGERGIVTQVIEQNSNGLYTYRHSSKNAYHNIIFDIYNAEMRLVISKTLFSGRDEYFIDAGFINNTLTVFFASYIKDKNHFEMRARKYSANLSNINSDTVLFTIAGNDLDKKQLRLERPKNYSGLLFLYTKQEQEIPSLYNYYVFDSVLNPGKSGEFNINIVNEYEVERVAFNNEMLVLQIREDVKRKVNKAGYRYIMASGKYGENFLKQVNLYNDSVTVTEGVLKADYKNGAFVFAGLYNKKDSTYAKGYCLWRQQFNGIQPVFTVSEFPYKAIAEMAGRNARIHGLYRLRVGDMILRNDGGAVLMGEEYEETREAVMDMNMYGVSQSTFRYYYYYENVLVLSINADGTLDWQTVLRKEQVSVNDNGMYSSYVVSALPDKLVYVYNDLSRKSWNLSLYEISAAGVAKNRIILRAQDYDARLIPQHATQIAHNEILVPGIGRKGYVLLKIKL